MLKTLRKNHGQVSMAQYVVLFFLAIGAVIAMTTFVQRALQARIRDTKLYMVDSVNTLVNGSNLVGGSIPYEYEPYYTNVSSVIGRNKNEESQLLGGGATGIFRKFVNAATETETNSEQAPPKDFNKPPA